MASASAQCSQPNKQFLLRASTHEFHSSSFRVMIEGLCVVITTHSMVPYDLAKCVRK